MAADTVAPEPDHGTQIQMPGRAGDADHHRALQANHRAKKTADCRNGEAPHAAAIEKGRKSDGRTQARGLKRQSTPTDQAGLMVVGGLMRGLQKDEEVQDGGEAADLLGAVQGSTLRKD